MVVFQSNLIMTLEALGSSSVVLPLEQKVCFGHNGATLLCRIDLARRAVALTAPSQVQAVLAHSLPLKQAKAGLRSLSLWGKVTTRNGKVIRVVAWMQPFIQQCDQHNQT